MCWFFKLLFKTFFWFLKSFKKMLFRIYFTLLVCTILWDFYHVPKQWSGEIASVHKKRDLDFVSFYKIAILELCKLAKVKTSLFYQGFIFEDHILCGRYYLSSFHCGCWHRDGLFCGKSRWICLKSSTDDCFFVANVVWCLDSL